MQPPRSREMKTSGQIGIPELGQNGHHHHHQLQQIQNGGAGMQSHFDHADAAGGGHDDFFDQMLSTLPSAWADLGNPKSPWGDISGSADAAAGQKLFGIGLAGKSAEEGEEGGGLQYAPYDESTLLASRLRQHQISGGGGGSQGGKGMIQLNPHHAAQQQMLLHGGVDSGLVPLPLSLGSDEGDGLYNGFGASMQQQHFHHAQIPGGGAPAGGAAAVQGGGGAAAPPRQRVRARRGQATDPHSIAERLRRERIAERMRALQELVPNANKTDKASMLDEIIEYVKFLQIQVKVLSMSRLGGAAAVAPLVAGISSEGGRSAAAAGGDNLAVAEHQVAKLMEEDMGSAMQYLQGKGLCLMPISLASAISSATCHPRVGGLLAMQGNGEAPSSPSMSVLTVQSAMANGGGGDAGGNSNKDAASVSKP